MMNPTLIKTLPAPFPEQLVAASWSDSYLTKFLMSRSS